jgi:hypothetical protein
MYSPLHLFGHTLGLQSLRHAIGRKGLHVKGLAGLRVFRQIGGTAGQQGIVGKTLPKLALGQVALQKGHQYQLSVQIFHRQFVKARRHSGNIGLVLGPLGGSHLTVAHSNQHDFLHGNGNRSETQLAKVVVGRLPHGRPHIAMTPGQPQLVALIGCTSTKGCKFGGKGIAKITATTLQL